jgi:hypothetical protein
MMQDTKTRVILVFFCCYRTSHSVYLFDINSSTNSYTRTEITAAGPGLAISTVANLDGEDERDSDPHDYIIMIMIRHINGSNV